jgi:hypothetical protein
MLEVARKMRGPDGTARVLVLDVSYEATKYRVYLGNSASRHAYYLRPPEGLAAIDLKKILDEAGGEAELEFRYHAYPELDTDLKPLLTADPYAAKHFGNNGDRRFLKLEGERPRAREKIAQLIDAFKEPFHAESFPRLHEFVLTSFTPATEGRRDELVLRRKDGSRDELRKCEPAFHVAVAEHGFAAEIEIYRPTVNETEPIFMLNTNESTGALGHAFLADMAKYFGSSAYVRKAEEASKEPAKKEAAVPAPTPVHHFQAPRIEAPKLDERQLTTKVAQAIKDLLPSMKLLNKREISQSGPYLTIQFPGVLGFGKGPSENEIKELGSIFRALKADPSFGSNWYARYQVDPKTGELRVAAGFDSAPPKGWQPIGPH